MRRHTETKMSWSCKIFIKEKENREFIENGWQQNDL